MRGCATSMLQNGEYYFKTVITEISCINKWLHTYIQSRDAKNPKKLAAVVVVKSSQ